MEVLIQLPEGPSGLVNPQGFSGDLRRMCNELALYVRSLGSRQLPGAAHRAGQTVGISRYAFYRCHDAKGILYGQMRMSFIFASLPLSLITSVTRVYICVAVYIAQIASPRRLSRDCRYQYDRLLLVMTQYMYIYIYICIICIYIYIYMYVYIQTCLFACFQLFEDTLFECFRYQFMCGFHHFGATR